MPLSTSSSDIPYREIPDRNWRLAWLLCVVLLIAALAGWEFLARSMQHMPGYYNSSTNFTTQWAEERRKLDEPGHGYRIVLLGSSRMLWGADLDILEQELGTRPLQLAIAGTSPALMLQSIVEKSDFDGLVLIGVTPFLFNRLDEGYSGKDALRWYEGAAPSEHTGYRIHSLLSAHFGFLDDGFKFFSLIDHYSNLPEREGVMDLNGLNWKLGNHYDDRQTDMWPPVEVEGSFDNKQILAFWMDGLSREPETPEEMENKATASVEFYAPLVNRLRERGGDAIFIRMPSRGKYLERDLASRYRELTWNPMSEGVDAVWINSMDYAELSSDLEIPEWSHLSRRSQDDFSRRIVPVLEHRYREARGRSIRDIIDDAVRAE